MKSKQEIKQKDKKESYCHKREEGENKIKLREIREKKNPKS